jgi:tetratricopeptide (TPR) repeat protein
MEDNTDVDRDWGYFYQMTGWIYFNQERLLEAREALQRALELNPKNKMARDLLLEFN